MSLNVSKAVSSLAVGRAPVSSQAASALKAPQKAAPAGPQLGLNIDAKKGKITGTVKSTTIDGVRSVEVPGFGHLPAPDPGKLTSFLVGEGDKLVSMRTNADDTVTFDTRNIGLEAKGSGFKGALLPDESGKIDIGGKQVDVKGLKVGKSKTKTIKINGKKYKVKLKLNADGSVSVEGKRKRGFFGSIIHGLGKALSFVGKLAPVLAAIPGWGPAMALVGKIAGGVDAVKGFISSIKSGNILGAISSVAGGVAGFASGAVKKFAETVAKASGFADQLVSSLKSGNILGAIGSVAGAVAEFAKGTAAKVGGTVAQMAEFAQQLGAALKYGLGKGIFTVVANGANLVSGAAGVAGSLGQGQFRNDMLSFANTASKVAAYSNIAEQARQGKWGMALEGLVTQFGPDIIAAIRRAHESGNKEYMIYKGVNLNIDPKQLNFDATQFDWTKAELGGTDLLGPNAAAEAQAAIDAYKEALIQGAGGGTQVAGQVYGPPAPKTPQKLIEEANTLQNQAGLAKESITGLVNRFVINPQKAQLGDLLAYRAKVIIAKNTQYSTLTAQINSLSRSLSGIKDPKQAQAVKNQIKALTNTRKVSLQFMDEKIAALGRATRGMESTIANNPLLKNLTKLGDKLNVLGAGIAVADGLVNGPQKAWETRLLAAALKGGGNYIANVAIGSTPIGGAALAVDALTGTNNVGGFINHTSDSVVGLLEMVGSFGQNTDTIEKVLEANRSGKNGPIVQQLTRFGDWVSNLFGN